MFTRAMHWAIALLLHSICYLKHFFCFFCHCHFMAIKLIMCAVFWGNGHPGFMLANLCVLTNLCRYFSACESGSWLFALKMFCFWKWLVLRKCETAKKITFSLLQCTREFFGVRSWGTKFIDWKSFCSCDLSVVCTLVALAVVMITMATTK